MLSRESGVSANVLGVARGSKNIEKEAERRRRAFGLFMKNHEIEDIAAWARSAGLPNANAVYNFLAGRSRSLSRQTTEALSGVIPGTVPEDLFSDVLSTNNDLLQRSFIRGEVQAGAWHDRPEWPRGDWKPITLPRAEIHKGTRSYFLIVRGNSMNQLYPEGTIIECVNLPEYDGSLKSGDKVVCVRRDRSGLYETTCKEYRLRNGVAQLWPRSDDPDHQEVITLPRAPQADDAPRADGIEEITIKAVVIRSIRTEV